MTCILVIVLSVFMLFLDWKLALLTMKIGILCTGKESSARPMTQDPAHMNFEHMDTFCVCSLLFRLP
jgi:hypothetical protein